MHTPITDGESDRLARSLRVIGEYMLVLVFGLLPLVFIPSDLVPFEYTKVLVAIVAVLVACVCVGLAALRSGSLTLRFSLPLAVLWGVGGITVLSALMSGDVRDAFLGESMGIHTAGFVLLMITTVSAVLLVDMRKQSVMHLYMLLAASTIGLVLFHVLRLFVGVDALSLGVFIDRVSTPVGSWNDLALFLGLSIVLSLVALDHLSLTRIGKVLFGGVIVAALAMLAIINFYMVWIVIGVVSLALLVYGLVKSRASDSLTVARPKKDRTVALGSAALVCILSCIFLIGGSTVGSAIARVTGVSYVEVRPSAEATMSIARNVYATHPVLGIGPNKFVDAWRLYKDPAINGTVFWNTDFIAGSGYIPTLFVATGVAGVIAWTFFFVVLVVQGLRTLLTARGEDRMWYFIGLSSFIAVVYLWGMSLLYVPGPVMLLLAALCTGIFLTARRALCGTSLSEYTLATDRRSGFVLTLAVIVVIILSAYALSVCSGQYRSLYAYNEGISALNRGAFEEARIYLERAYVLYPSDVYARRVGEMHYARMYDLMQIPNPSDADKALFSDMIRYALDAATRARIDDPLEYENASLVGNLYSVLMDAQIEGVYDRAKEALMKAQELNPKSPTMALNLGVLEGRAGNYDAARTYTEEAIALKPNYTEAYNFLSQIEVGTGNVEAAIRSAQSLIRLEPTNPIRYYQLGVLEGARNNAENAARAFEEAVARDPQYANARYLLALAYEDLGRDAEARTELEKVLALNPGNADVIALLGRIGGTPSVRTDVSSSTTESTPSSPELNDASVPRIDPNTGAVTTDQNPNSPLVTPVNIVPESPQSTEAANE